MFVIWKSYQNFQNLRHRPEVCQGKTGGRRWSSPKKKSSPAFHRNRRTLQGLPDVAFSVGGTCGSGAEKGPAQPQLDCHHLQVRRLSSGLARAECYPPLASHNRYSRATPACSALQGPCRQQGSVPSQAKTAATISATLSLHQERQPDRAALETRAPGSRTLTRCGGSTRINGQSPLADVTVTLPSSPAR